MPGRMLFSATVRMAIAAIIVAALLIVPAPLLPPHRLAEAVQAHTGLSWKVAYFVTAVGLVTAFYGALGVLAAIAVPHAASRRARLVQVLLVPVALVGFAIAMRAYKLGHVPVLPNVVVPAIACLAGVALGFVLRYRGWMNTVVIAVVVVGIAFWGFFGTTSAGLGHDTALQLGRLIAAGPKLPQGDARFGAMMQVVFAPMPQNAAQRDAIQNNRSAILALGIALGHQRLARYVALDPNGELVQKAVALRQDVSLRGRPDWVQHYTLSAALTILQNPLISDVGGLMKEELDAVTQGSGFSFGDLAADRAGVRFAAAATRSDADARAMQSRIRDGFAVNDFFPDISDLPENLTVAQFRSQFGGVGTDRYRSVVADIETRLDQCAALGGK